MPPKSMSLAENRISAMRVLVADPYSQLREIIRDILLRGIGVAEVLEARNGREALDTLHDLPCDVVIADTAMDPVGALELTQKIRGGHDGIDPFTPIIVMSGNANLGEIIAVRDAGANDYVAKPLSAKILDLRLHAVVSQPRPFIRSDDFFGPDRRRHMNAIFRGADRRNTESETIDPGAPL
ncbi:response regulator [Magnetovibrio sp.]|uniref:response regulator n=1 Tax=Magnetovibrio sp. TaxID=2024836 RepID=UPI002F94933B